MNTKTATARISRLGLIFVGTYLALYIAAAVWTCYIMTTDTINSALSGLWQVMLTAPWSLAWMAILDLFYLDNWYARFASQPLLYTFLASVTLLPAAIPTGLGLYLLGRFLEHPDLQ